MREQISCCKDLRHKSRLKVRMSEYPAVKRVNRAVTPSVAQRVTERRKKGGAVCGAAVDEPSKVKA